MYKWGPAWFICGSLLNARCNEDIAKKLQAPKAMWLLVDDIEVMRSLPIDGLWDKWLDFNL